ncbi:MAG TPA: cupin domain-containing protein [Bacteroidota bacterium]|nr:cupin domain-containing protein [Bacteroidota bacterium]
MHRATILAFLLGSVTTAVSQSPPSVAPAGQSAQWTIDRCVNTFNPARAESTKAGYQYWFADKAFLDGRTLKLSVVRAGTATHAPHTHGEDEFFFVLEGKAEFVMNGDSVRVGPMTSLYCPPGSFHGIRNIGNTDLKYLVIKKYELVSPAGQKKP